MMIAPLLALLFSLAFLFSFQDAVPLATPTLQPLHTYTLQCPVTGATNPSFQWQRVEGPQDIPFSNANTQTTTVSFIEQGTYLIRCVVSDVGKDPAEAYWQVTVGAAYVPLPSLPSPMKAEIVMVPPPGARDTIPPIIGRVMYGSLQLTEGQTVNLTSSIYAGFNVSATDNTAVLSYGFIVKDTPVDAKSLDSPLPPAFNVYWLKNPIVPGTYPAVIRVYDGSGNFDEFRFTLRR